MGSTKHLFCEALKSLAMAAGWLCRRYRRPLMCQKAISELVAFGRGDGRRRGSGWRRRLPCLVGAAGGGGPPQPWSAGAFVGTPVAPAAACACAALRRRQDQREDDQQRTVRSASLAPLLAITHGLGTASHRLANAFCDHLPLRRFDRQGRRPRPGVAHGPCSALALDGAGGQAADQLAIADDKQREWWGPG